MDKEQAKFILQSFRPDGADAADNDFAEALQLATEDRELGEWLADERAADAAFSEALCEVEIPEELRQHILAVMRGEKPSDPEFDLALDEMLIDAVGDVQPPEGLRDQILAAMEMEHGVTESATEVEAPSNVIIPSASQAGWFTGWKKLTAVAAAVVLGAFMAFQMTSTNSSKGLISSYEVQQHAGQMLNANFELDVKGEDPNTINTWLVSHELPAPTSLPTRLQALNSLGCKEIILPGDKKASLLCFSEANGGMVHIIIIKNEHIEDRNLPAITEITQKDCYHCPETKWNIARWQDDKNTYIMLAKKDASKKDELLQYF